MFNPVFIRLSLPQNSFISIFLLFLKPIPLLSNQRCCIQLQNQYHTIPLYQYHAAYKSRDVKAIDHLRFSWWNSY